MTPEEFAQWLSENLNHQQMILNVERHRGMIDISWENGRELSILLDNSNKEREAWDEGFASFPADLRSPYPDDKYMNRSFEDGWNAARHKRMAREEIAR